MKIFFSPYCLERTDQTLLQEGTLVRVQTEKSWGVADLCPRLELGDRDFRTEIQEDGSLYQRAIELAVEDANARREGIHLLQDKPLLTNLLVTDYRRFDFSAARLDGATLKIKGDKQVEELAQVLNGIECSVQLRVDFNAKLDAAEFEKFFSLLSSQTLRKIEYVEDPTTMDSRWFEWNKKIPLAYDIQPRAYVPEWARFFICKPARQKIPENTGHVTFTSAMDHPIGFAHGLRYAQMSSHFVCGFSTLNLYSDQGFHQYFRMTDRTINFSESALKDFGIGMTDELNKLKWLSIEEVVG